MNLINFGFIILSPDHNIGGLKNTLRSIRNFYGCCNIISIIEKNTKKENIKESKEICEIYKGGKTITSLINKGLEETKSEWNIIIMEGARVGKNLDKKYSMFINSEKDILFPLIVDYDLYGYPKKINNKIYNCTLNGLCINKNFFKLVGKLTDNPLEISRKFWALEAIKNKAQFKSILGVKIC